MRITCLYTAIHTLCNPMDYRVHRILQARTLEWVVFPFSRGASQPRDQTQVSYVAGRFFTCWATREALTHTATHNSLSESHRNIKVT